MTMSPPSAILMGSKPGSVVALASLLKRGWEVKHVVVSRRSDSLWMPGPSLEEFAIASGLPVVTAQDQLPRAETVDFVLSYLFRYRVKADVRALARRAALNFHPAPLPEFGGWAFYNVAILENAPAYGCSCHYMDDGFDSGPLVRVRRFPIEASRETAYSLEQRAQAEMIKLFLEVCDQAQAQQTLLPEAQDPRKRRYLSRLEFEALREIPADADDQTIDRYARAFWYPPYEGAYLKVGNTKVEIIPKRAREDIAAVLHARDLERLQDVARAFADRSAANAAAVALAADLPGAGNSGDDVHRVVGRLDDEGVHGGP